MAKVRVISPDGQAGTLDDSELEKAKASGYRLETADDVTRRGYGNQKLRTFAEGAARTASLGLSDPFLKGTGVDPKDIAGRREENPGSALTGELAGVMLPFGAGAGIARVERGIQGAIEGAAPTVARKFAARAASGAAGGGLWGLGASISEDALEDGDKQLAGEKLLAVAGGGLAGAGLGVLETGIGMAGSSVVNKLVGKSLKDKLSEFSEEVMVRQIAQQSDFKKMNLFDRRREVGRYALDKGWGAEAAKGGMEALHNAAANDSDEIGAKMGGVLREADARTHGVDTARIAARVQKEVLDPIAKDPLMAQSRKAVSEYVGELDAQPYRFEELWQLQSNLRKKVGPTEPGVFKESLWKMRKITRDELIDQSGEISPHFKEQLVKLNRDYGYSEQIEQLAEKRLIQQEGNRYVSPSDYITGSAAAIAGASTSGPVGVMAGGVAALANKLARERGGFAISEIGDRLAKSKIVQQMANGFKTHLDTIFRESPELLGAYRVPLQQAAARGAMDLLATHVQTMAHDPDYAAHVGVVEEGPELTDEYLQRGEKLTAIDGVLKGFNARSDLAVDKFLGMAPGRPGNLKHVQRSIKDFNEQVDTLNRLITQGGALVPSLDKAAPGTSTMLQMASMTSAKFLLEKAPKSPYIGKVPALTRPWEPSTTALNKWYRYVEAVENPQHVLHELSGGMVVPEHIEAMSNVYPKLLEDLRQKMLSRMAALDTSLPYSKRLALSGFLGTDILGVSSEQLMLIQGLHMEAQQPKMGGGGGPRPDGRQNVDQEKNLETQAQRMENRS